MAEYECKTHSAQGSGGREHPADDECSATASAPLSVSAVSLGGIWVFKNGLMDGRSFEQASPFLVGVGTQADLSDLVVKSR